MSKKERQKACCCLLISCKSKVITFKSSKSNLNQVLVACSLCTNLYPTVLRRTDKPPVRVQMNKASGAHNKGRWAESEPSVITQDGWHKCKDRTTRVPPCVWWKNCISTCCGSSETLHTFEANLLGTHYYWWVRPPFAFGTGLLLCDGDSTRWWMWSAIVLCDV